MIVYVLMYAVYVTQICECYVDDKQDTERERERERQRERERERNERDERGGGRMRAKEERRASATVQHDKTIDGNNPQPPPKMLSVKSMADLVKPCISKDSSASGMPW